MATLNSAMGTTSHEHQATRLNGLEQVRLQQRLQLLDKARLRQAKLTNQDIRLTSAALDYVLTSSGHSPEGRNPATVDSQDWNRTQPQFFLYGERVLSRKVRRFLRPGSASTEHSRPQSPADLPETRSTMMTHDHVQCLRTTHTPRPHSSQARERSWRIRHNPEETPKTNSETGENLQADCGSSIIPGSSATSSSSSFNRGMVFLATSPRLVPHQAWEDDVHEVTKKLLKAQQQQQQQEELQQGNSLSKVCASRRSRVKRGWVTGPCSALSSTYLSFPGPSVSGTGLPVLPVKENMNHSARHGSGLMKKRRPKSSGSASGKAAV